MKRAVLADTGPLYAAVDPDDAHHKRAHRELRRLAGDQQEVLVAYPTLLEAYTLLLFRLGKAASSRWLTDLAQGATLINPTPEDYRQAVARILSFSDQPITLFDSVVAVLAARLDVDVWTYDHHFDLMRVPVWR
jgi:predicted nucleic acid-binding protein